MIYFNLKTSYGVETIDSLDKKEFATRFLFRCEVMRLSLEYRLSGQNIYISQRATKDYYNNI